MQIFIQVQFPNPYIFPLILVFLDINTSQL